MFDVISRFRWRDVKAGEQWRTDAPLFTRTKCQVAISILHLLVS
jgi:hypothetical protein